MPSLQKDKPEEALARLSGELGSIFDGMVQSIGEIRSSAGEFAACVNVLQGLGGVGDDPSDAAEDASFAAFSQRAEQAAAAAEGAAEILDEGTFQAGLNSLAAALHGLKRNIVELAAISSLIKIAKTGSPDLIERLTVFTETLDTRFNELGASTSEAARRIDAIRTESRDARKVLAAIACELQAISRKSGADGCELDTLRRAHLDEVDRMVRESGTLGAQVQSAVGRVIACLQFPDSFAQRIEHLRAILAAGDRTDDPGQKSTLAHLAVAHLDDMADALRRTSDSGLAALDSIPLPHDRADRGSRSGQTDASLSWMEAERRANDVMIEAVTASRHRLDAAVARISRVVTAVDTIRDMLEQAHRQNLELNISVYNASLMASRDSGSASALHVLADGVKSVVARVSREVASILSDLGRIRHASETLKHSPLAHELDFLERIQELAARKADEDVIKLDRATEARAQLQRSVARLATSAAEGRRRFDAARGYSQPLRDIASALREGPAFATAPAAVDLAWLEAIYTMNEERDIHRAAIGALGLSAETPDLATAKPEAAEDAELDDFLL